MCGKANKLISYFSYGLVFLYFFPSIASSNISGNCQGFNDPLKAPVECVNIPAHLANTPFEQEDAILRQGRKDVRESVNSVKRLAGWLDKVTGDKTEKGGASKGLGGLFKSLKIPNQGQSAAGTQSANTAQDDSSPFSRYSSASSEVMDFICTKHKREWAYDYPAPDTSLLAADFKVPVAELPTIFQEEFYKVKYTAVPNPQNFENSFDSPRIKELFLKFLSEKSPEILSQFKKIALESSSSSSGMTEQADAIFAYGLLVLQYSDQLSDASIPLRYIKKAWKKGQRGANYVWGALIFYGEAGLRRDVNIAANFVANANADPEADDRRGQDDGGGAKSFEPFAPAAALLTKISMDPEFKHKEMYASLRKDAEQFKKKWIKKKNTGSALYRQATQLNYRSVVALEALAKALGLGKMYNEAAEQLLYIVQQRDPDRALVKKSLRVKETLVKAIKDELANRDKLDADEIAALQKTADANRRVTAQFAATVAQIFMSQMASGGMITPDTLSDWTYTVPMLVKGKDTSCQVREDLRVAYLNKQDGNKTLQEPPDSPEEQAKTKKAQETLGDEP